MVLKTMWRRYKSLIYLKNGLVSKGYNFKSLSYLNSQIEILNQLIKEESYNVLEQLLRKTNYRLLKQIKKGSENLVDIINYPERWRLCKIENCLDEWLNNNSLIFSTERKEILAFTQNDKNHGQKYINNKWQ
ncbi:MAG: hypothetical protein PHO58_05775 [Bacilli bacterium]|jgi:hypothetical protein|nr:hypothetical protein [Candidatus Paceibacterota bacterium]MDD4411979.1 hypothetical protein [Bacilli bacterium]